MKLKIGVGNSSGNVICTSVSLQNSATGAYLSATEITEILHEIGTISFGAEVLTELGTILLEVEICINKLQAFPRPPVFSAIPRNGY